MQASVHIGVGLYTYADAARILGTSQSKLRSWVTSGSYVAHGRHYERVAVIPRVLEGEPVLTFQELIELLFIRMFRDARVSMQTVRKAAARASARFGSEYPFSVKRFDTDGQRIFATLLHEACESGETELVEDIERGQLAFQQVVQPFFRQLIHDHGDVRQLWPRSGSGRVVLDPERNFGAPIDAETGIPTATLAQAVQANGVGSEALVADWFAVPLEAVHAAVSYESAPAAA